MTGSNAPAPASGLERRHSRGQQVAIGVCRWIALVALVGAAAAILVATLVLPWFVVEGSSVDYPYLFEEVQRLAPLGDVPTAWFRGLFFIPTGIAVLFVGLAAGRNRRGRLIARGWVMLGLVAAIALSAADLVHDLTSDRWSPDQLREQLIEDGQIFAFFLGIALVLWLVSRTRRALGPAIVALVVALPGLGLHVVLLLLAWSSGVRVLAGPVVVAVGLALLVLGILALLVAAAVEGPRVRRQRTPRRPPVDATGQASTSASSGASKLA